jgi:methylated-DNA-[protein]-cysteine S-methyltransferase
MSKGELQSSSLASPIGKLYLLTRADTVLALNLSGFSALLSSLSADELSEKINKSNKGNPIAEKLERYFNGELSAINTIKVKQPGGEFTQAAWSAMRRIKAGRADSYADLAHSAGRPAAIRAAGSACAKNKILLIVPCHRVIKTGGAIGNYGPGVDKKVWLLRHEGALD